MNDEMIIRIAVFCGLFGSLAFLEVFVPRRPLTGKKSRRWLTNWAIVLIDSFLVRLLFKTAAVGGAIWAGENGIGLFNWVEVPYWLAFIVSFVALDFSVWLWHVAAHKVPVLWLVHRMHHADIDIDVSTALRFHPIEIVLSMALKYATVIALGAPAEAVLVFEIVLNGGAMFNHSNFKLPLTIDRWLRLVIVTPDMHRVHHSVERHEHDSNYGFNLSLWDRLFFTYTDQPEKGHDQMKIGLKQWQDERPTFLGWTLMIPFDDQR